MVNVGAISYINALPFFLPFTQKKVAFEGNFHHGQPTEINALLDTGKVSVALISSAHFLAKRQNYILLSPYGIAASKRVVSVRLYFRDSIQNLNNKVIALTKSSETSAKLLKVLCHHFWNIRPHFVEYDQLRIANFADTEVDGFLIIGDTCLKNLEVSGFQSVDLAECWNECTNKPFIFALFATRSSCWIKDPVPIKNFHNLLDQAYAISSESMQETIREAKDKTDLSEAILQDYYNTLEYVLEAQHFQGLELFSQLLHRIETAQ
jgi:putative periplasmic solute-binding protein